MCIFELFFLFRDDFMCFIRTYFSNPFLLWFTIRQLFFPDFGLLSFCCFTTDTFYLFLEFLWFLLLDLVSIFIFFPATGILTTPYPTLYSVFDYGSWSFLHTLNYILFLKVVLSMLITLGLTVDSDCLESLWKSFLENMLYGAFWFIW